MRKLVVSTLILVLMGCAYLKPHPRPWTQTEKVVAGYFLAAHALDGYTTKRHQDYPERFEEVNPILGEHPRNEELVIYFCITGLAAIALCHFYPELRIPLLGAYGSVNLYCAHENYHLVKDRDE